MSSEAKRFDSVSTPEEWGVADATGLHLYESHRDAPSGFPFGVCRIDDRQVAVFIETEASVEDRAELASRKPDWLDAIVYARVISDPHAALAEIDAQVLSPDDAELERCAFAIACVAFGLGLFKVVPRSYSIRFEARATALVTMAFDDDAESWFGEVAMDFGASR